MSTLFKPPPPPPSALGRYRILSPNAGVHVSPIQLGAMSIGDKWAEHGMGSMDKESSFKLLDAYFDLGETLLIPPTTSNQSESSEEFIGEWSEARGIRDQLFIATKGVSDTPAWVVSRANQYARDHALTPFVIYQGAWNVIDRSFQREIIPMARAEGMALAPWNVLAAGRFELMPKKKNVVKLAVCKALEKVAAELGGKQITSVAIAYLMNKTPYVFPIIGGRKVEHLKTNIEGLEISLTKEQIQYIESVVPLDPGFPAWMIGTGDTLSSMLSNSANFDRQPLLEPIRPAGPTA
ncbi:NADP-dependent oxidoreductase domain-containing protein [Cyathus striatus]|nr:NADP-dependent oxidoreductase domain-containing protein [Cyathus striatus]